jgi:hypothetical protein
MLHKVMTRLSHFHLMAYYCFEMARYMFPTTIPSDSTSCVPTMITNYEDIQV